MIVCIDNLLSSDQLDDVRRLTRAGEFEDGRKTAGWHAQLVKKNHQLSKGEQSKSATAIIFDAIAKNEVFQAAVLPHKIRPPLFSRYEVGMEYGTHVDNALMGQGAERARTDVSFTVFLNDPDTYDGGELIMDTPGGEQVFKLPAGAAITYPSTTLHRVAPVTRGVREVAVSWVQSMVRHADRREALFDLANVRQALFQRDGKSREFDLVVKTYANLLRSWAEV